MNPSKLGKQLRREITGHPAKAGILGMLCLVALWFWAPLVWKWAGFGGQAAASDTDAEPPDPIGPLVTPMSLTKEVGDKDAPVSETPWHQRIQWMDDDPRTQPTNPLWGHRDPFLVPRVEEVVATVVEAVPKVIEEPPAPLSPGDVGMVLTGTLIGSKRRVAQINGRPYRQGDVVRLHHAGEPIEFVLASVASQRIYLERDNEQFELKITKPTASGRIEFLDAPD